MMDDGKSVLSSSWAFLPPDLLRLLYKNLYDSFDFIHFRAVCKSWRAAAPMSDHPPQFPFFLFREGTCSSEFKLCSYTGKTHTLQVPEACNKQYLGQSQGYLITYPYRYGDDSTNPFLLNPFTGAQRQLPLRGCCSVVILHVSGDPFRNTGDLIMHVKYFSHQRKIVILSGNQCKEWSNDYSCCPTAYYKGSLFNSVSGSRSYVTIDMMSREKSEIKVPGTNNGFIYLVEGPGTLFGIEKQWHSDITMAPFDHCLFDVYRLDENEKPPRWVKQTNIGDLMIFLNDADGFCLSANDFDGFKGNCIYFSTRGWHGNRPSLRRYDLGKNKLEVIGEVKSFGCWFVPDVYK